MKTVLLAGGFGTRLAEETEARPKPMVEIGKKPILLHIMDIYSHYGYHDFIVACGYKAHFIKEYFCNYHLHCSDWTFDLSNGQREILQSNAPNWQVSCIDTGLEAMTGGRILRLKPWLSSETFMVTYGDGLADININELVKFHKSHGKLATVTAVRPPARFGGLVIDNSKKVTEFTEKSQLNEGWINGGFFVFEPKVIDYIKGYDTPLEKAPLENLAADGQLMAFHHEGFWQPMDTIREKRLLEELWESGNAPWDMQKQNSRAKKHG